MHRQPEQDRVAEFNQGGQARLLLLCEHASNFIPARFNKLQLNEAAQVSHAAFDLGALQLAQEISKLLDAPLLATTVSRLVYDCNRAFDAADAIPPQSEVFDIPGNHDLSEFDRRERYDEFYLPFEEAITKRLAEFDQAPILLTIHSFTPVFHGKPRALEIGIIGDGDRRLMERMVQLGKQQSGYQVEANQPYGPGDGTTHTLNLHGDKNDLPNAMIEVRNDLLASRGACQDMALVLARLISDTAATFGYQLPLGSTHAGIS